MWGTSNPVRLLGDAMYAGYGLLDTRPDSF
jgi:hypothetical protein